MSCRPIEVRPERRTGHSTIRCDLTGITAAVVGVIAQLSLYFGVYTLFERTHLVTGGPLHLQLPDLASVRLISVIIVVIGAGLIFR